jgi:hypothetical protein
MNTGEHHGHNRGRSLAVGLPDGGDSSGFRHPFERIRAICGAAEGNLQKHARNSRPHHGANHPAVRNERPNLADANCGGQNEDRNSREGCLLDSGTGQRTRTETGGRRSRQPIPHGYPGEAMARLRTELDKLKAKPAAGVDSAEISTL